MNTRDRILEVIYAVVDEINAGLPPDERLTRTEATTLYGAGAGLDSLALVTAIVAVEQGLNAAFGSAITLADEKAMSQRRSPFRTIGSLATYAEELLPNP